jgi:hypothetical protein
MPRGVSYEGVVGAEGNFALRAQAMLGARKLMAPMMTSSAPVPVAPPVQERREIFMPKPIGFADTSKIDATLMQRAKSLADVLRVKIWLTDDSKTVLDQLKKLGVTVRETKPGKLVFGEVRADKLEELSKVAAVLWISADLGNP